MKDYKTMTKAQLIETGTALGLSLTMRMRKDNMIAAIEAATDKATDTTDTDTTTDKITDKATTDTTTDKATTDTDTDTTTDKITDTTDKATTDIIKISTALAPFEGFDGEIVLTEDTEIIDAIRDGIRECGFNQLSSIHEASGCIDYALGVYEGKDLIYLLPCKCHATRFTLASIFGDPAHASSLYVEAPASSKTHNFIGLDGKPYACKQTGKHEPIAQKFTVGKYFRRFVSEIVGFNIYQCKHSDNISWVNARNLKYSVRPVKDLEVS